VLPDFEALSLPTALRSAQFGEPGYCRSDANMSTAEATDQQGQSGDARVPNNRASQSTSPLRSATWLLRTGAITVALAGVIGLIVAPGLRGIARETTVVFWDWAAGTLSCFALITLVALACWGAQSIVRSRPTAVVVRAVLTAGAVAVVPIAVAGLHGRLPQAIAVLLAVVAATAAIAGAWAASSTPHTRALAGVLLALACASLLRIAGWEVAMWASVRGDVALFRSSRMLMTSGVGFEALGQIVAVTWLGTRGRTAGQVASSIALFAAFLLTWGVAKGMQSDCAPWQAAVHTALAGAAGVPAPLGVDGLAIFVLPASLLLALAFAVQSGPVVAIVAAAAMALVSRGAFDAPLRALCAVVAAEWAAIAAADERAMWRSFTATRM